MRTVRLPLTLLLVTAATMSLRADAADAGKADPRVRTEVPRRHVPGEGLLKLKGIHARELLAAKSCNAAASAWKDLAARTGVALELIRPSVAGWAYVRVRAHDAAAIPDEEETAALLARLAADPAVSAVSPNKWYRTLTTPNDPYMDNMWHFDVIGASAAWDITTGGTSQRVGIIDTGLVRSHEDVGGRAVAGYDFISHSGMANDGDGRDADFDDAGDGCGEASSWHGTHVAGTIGASANNGKGVAGLNWQAGLVIARALGCGGGQLVDIYEGAAWMAGINVGGVPAIGAHKVQVMNLSLGSDEPCTSYEQDVIDLIEQQGVIFVAAAGNSSTTQYVAPVGSPASCDNVVSVAAHGPNRDITDYSSFGPEVDIVAPGGDFRYGESYGVLSSVGPTSNDYLFQQGTSMAAPHVAGVISLMLDVNPGLTRAQVVSLLQTTGTACDGCGSTPAMVASAAVAAVNPGAGPAPPPPSLDDSFEENDTSLTAKAAVGCGEERSLMALADDKDWFSFPASEGQQVTVTLSAHNGADLDLYLYNAEHREVVTSTSPTGDEQLTFTGDGTPFLVLVDPYVDTQRGILHQGPYTLGASCVGGTDPGPITPPADGDDALEDNDSMDTAAEMFCDATRDLVAADEDWFFVDARHNDKVAAEITTPGRPLVAQILNADGEVLAEGSATEVAEVFPVPAGRYFIHITPVGAGGGYKLRAACTADAIDDDPTDLVSVGSGCTSAGGAPLLAALVALMGARRRRGG